jgi:hypothetical protein
MKGIQTMVIRRIVSGVLATGVIAGGGIALAPSAFALPRECGVYVNDTDYYWNVYSLDASFYGNYAFPTVMAFNNYYAAYGRQLDAGC